MKTIVGVMVIAAFFCVVAFARSGKVLIPESSAVHGRYSEARARTTILRFIPDKVEFGKHGEPVAENPLSLACIYKLVKLTKGCPQTSNVVPNGGSRAIAIVDAFDNPNAESDIQTFASAY